jgi:DNA mismatch repair ATPase MutL
VSASYQSFQLSGLLSPPLPDCCHWTKEYQYLFVNNRWMRGKDIIANMVDKVYVTSMTSQKSGGPASKHHMPKGNQISSHPCFVLQLTCPTESYDVLSEPDKTKAVFSDPYALKLCVEKLLLQMFEKHNPDLLAAADNLCGGYSNGDATYGIFRTDNDAILDDTTRAKNGAPALETAILYAVHPREERESKRWTPHNKVSQPMSKIDISSGSMFSKSPTFSTAFLETPPDKIPIPVEARHFTSQPLSLFAEFEFDSSVTGDTHDSDEADTTEGALSPYDSASDTDSNRYSYVDSTAEADTMRRGVTVSRLPDIEEYIDQQLMSRETQSPSSLGGGEGGGYEDAPTLSEEVYDDASSDLSEFYIGTPTRDGLGIDSAPHSPNFSRSRNSLHSKAAKHSNSTDNQHLGMERKYYSPNSKSSPREGWSDCADSDDDFLSGVRPYNSSAYSPDLDDCKPRGSCSTSSNFQDDATTPSALRTLDQPTNLFQSDFNNIFFSSNPHLANIAPYNPRKCLHPYGKLYDNMADTIVSIIGAKRSRESNSALSQRLPETLDSDFNFSDTRSKLIESSSSSSLIKVPAAATTAMTLRKDMLTGLKTIGQVDSKYLLVVSGKLILIVDQHAADERVKLEEMLGSSNTEGTEGGMGITDTLPVCETVELTPGDLFTLTSRAEVFRDWGFIFEISETSEPAEEGAECAGAVRLTQVPVIHGEALNAQDFVVTEYSRWMAPRSMLRPPSVQRIAASKACRSAVRFGDVLDHAACADIMVKLSRTDLPFQCAHGRPSVVPLLLLGQSHESLHTSALFLPASKESKYTKTPNYSSLLL